jgi:hypothetical protein
MSGELVRDRLVLGLLFVVGGSSLLWGLYSIFYVSSSSPSGIFNTVLGLLVLLITWAFLLPYALPAARVGHVAPARRDSVPSPPPAPTVAAARPPPASRTVAPRPSPPLTVAVAPAQSPLGAARATVAVPVPPVSPPVTTAPVPPTAPVRPAAPARPAASSFRSDREDSEIEEILAELPGPVDSTLADETPDQVIRRLDALLEDLSSGSG